MEVSIISRETIKPSSLPLHHMKPHKLCLFDQLFPSIYISVVLFFPNYSTHRKLDVSQSLAQLKKSNSETLALFYPFSGRAKDNFCVEDFDDGITYVEASVNCSMAEFFKLRQTELLNEFVPFLPFRLEPDPMKLELGFQVNVFTCGGMAIGSSLAHKVGDGGTLSQFLTCWTAAFRASPEKILRPNFSDAAVIFPPIKDLHPEYRTLMDKLWFNYEGNFVTKRFVFNAAAVATLRDIAKSEHVRRPSRNDAVTCFIWKHASATASPRRASIIVQAVNLRPRMKNSEALNTSFGNVFWWQRAAYDTSKDDVNLSELVKSVRESLESFNKKFSKKNNDFSDVWEFYETIERNILPSELDFYGFTNWGGFFNELDFGWGKPIWVGAHGNVGSVFSNLTVLVDAQGGKEVEAFVTLDEKRMAALEKDSKFLAFASPNPQVVSDYM